MRPFERPEIAQPEYRDAAGAVIPYGSRWAGSPPEESYSRTSHLERFAPLHTVADALITWLTNVFDAEAADDVAFAADLVHPRTDAVRAVRVTPADPDAAPLTFAFTPYPGIELHAGAVTDRRYPVCGCDACDEGPLELLDELEQDVAAVITGGLGERLIDAPADFAPPGPGQVIAAVEMQRPDGGGSRSTGAVDLPDGRRDAVLARLAGRTSWAPWPVR